LTQRFTRLAERSEAKQQQLAGELARIDQLVAAAQVADESAVPETARRVQRWHELRDEQAVLEQQLSTFRGEEDAESFAATLASADSTELASQGKILEAELEQVDRQFDDALRALGVATLRLEELDQASQAVVLGQELELTRSQLAEAVEQWVPVTLARACMRLAMERFEKEHQPQLLIEVGRLLRRMTLGRHTGLSRKLDEQGTLLVHQADGQVKEPHQLSTGTREQLYLAIRLAYVLHYCREAEPLPIVMDDVLVNFDDARAAATLDALVDVGRHVQVILLTCHQSTRELARARMGGQEPIRLSPAGQEAGNLEGHEDGAQ
jgi:uncharacterized protein YhaN